MNSCFVSSVACVFTRAALHNSGKDKLGPRMGLMGSKRSDKVDPGPVDLKDVEVSVTPFPKKRACTDVICLLLLLIFMAVLIGLLVYCIKYGDIARIIQGYDRCGNVCGRVTERIGIAPDDPKYACLGADMRKNRFLLVTGAGLRESNDFNVNRECVISCQFYLGFREFANRCIPEKGAKKGDQRQANWNTYANGYGSSGGSVGHSGRVGGWVSTGKRMAVSESEAQKRRYVSAQVVNQPPIVVNTKNKGYPDLLLPLKGNRFRRHAQVRMRRLLQYQQQGPVDPADRIDIHFSKTGYRSFFQEVAEDLELCWKELLALFFIALGFTLVLMLFLIVAVRVVLIMSLAVGIIVSLTATAYLWAQWAYEQDRLSEEYRFYPQWMSKIEMRLVDSYLGYAIAATVFLGILLLVLFVTRKKLGLVIRLFEESGRAISDMPELLILPWVSFAFAGGLIAGWFYLALWIESSGKLVSENNVNFVYAKDAVVHVARWWNLVALFWLVEFVMACQHLVVAGAVGDWYFTRNKEALRHPVDRSLARTICYHLGTAVFCATLVAPLHFLRTVFQEMYRRLKPTAAQQMLPEGAPSVVADHATSTPCINCIMYPFVKFIAFLNRNACVEVALTGCSFIEGGRRALRLIVKNAFDMALVNTAGDFVLFMAKIGVMLSTMLVAIVFFQDKQGVMHVWVPITLAAIFGYVVAHIFITVYEMGVDTIFICFCEDCENNDGSDRPYFMSKELLEFVEESDPKTHERLVLAMTPKEEIDEE